MPTYQLKTRDQILRDMSAYIVARTNLTDLTNSSALRHLLQAVANEVNEAYFQMARLQTMFSLDTAMGTDLDERAKEMLPPFDSRRPGLNASGTVVFFAAAPVTSTVLIPAGTIVRGPQFSATTQAATIIAPSTAAQIPGHSTGQDSIPVLAKANNAGSAGNVGIGVVNAVAVAVSGVVSATNITSFFGGVDLETDDQFRARIRRTIASLSTCTPFALESLILGLQDPLSLKRVVYAKAFEDSINRGDVTIYIDDGSGTAKEWSVWTAETILASALGTEIFVQMPYFPIKEDETLVIYKDTGGGPVALSSGSDYYLNPTTGIIEFTSPLNNSDVITGDWSSYDNLIKYISKIIEGVASDRSTFPGLRPAGTLVRVKAPDIRSIEVELTYVPVAGEDPTLITPYVLQTVIDYINTLGIGEDVIVSEIVQRVMEVRNVYDVTVTEPASNEIINTFELARTSPGIIVINGA